MNKYAPVVLFVYNRPDHTLKTMMALKENFLASESDLFIFSDAPKHSDAESQVREVRKIIDSFNGFKSITIIKREINFGLVRSISEGVTDIINRFGKIIVIEDDLLTHKQFLEFMNKALDVYQKTSNVYEITGYSYLASKNSISENTAYFLTISSTWGWATWADRWKIFSNGLTGVEVLQIDKKLRYKFNYNNSYNYTKLIRDSNAGTVKSWGIVWYWNIFKNMGLTLYPPETLIDQIGFDGSGENSKNYLSLPGRIVQKEYLFDFPEAPSEVTVYRSKITRILRLRKIMIVINVFRHLFKKFAKK